MQEPRKLRTWFKRLILFPSTSFLSIRQRKIQVYLKMVLKSWPFSECQGMLGGLIHSKADARQVWGRKESSGLDGVRVSSGGHAEDIDVVIIFKDY